MSTDAATLDQLLAELRQLAVDVAPVAEHLAKIDAQLAKLPSSDEVDELRSIVTELQEAVTELKAFQDGPPPIPQRLKELEEKYDRFVIATGEREGVIADAAGVAGDPAHRTMARGEATTIVDRAVAAQTTVNEGFAARILDLFRITSGLQSANIRLVGVLVLVGSAAGSIMLRVFGVF